MARLNEPPLAPSAAQPGPTPPPGTESLEASESPTTHMSTTDNTTLSARDQRSMMRTKSRVLPQKVHAPADPDEVKRRFVRQNRELAKSNSTQNLRIRGLEIDVQKLLQANQELRAEVIRVRLEVQRARGEGLEVFREEVLGRLGVLVGFVEGAGREDLMGNEEQRRERKKEVLARFEYRERQGLKEVMRESQMPVIEEAKSFPRRTLEEEEVKAVRLSASSTGESPDLGPPPVARFDYEDPIKFNVQAEPLDNETGEADEEANEEELPATLSVNLETRRRRKDGQPKLEIRRHSILPPPSPSSGEGEVVAPTLRVGAKRKLADRDLDKPVQAPSKTDFTFHRRVPSNEQVKLSEGPAPVLQKPVEAPEAVVASPIKASRKVLGDKSVNHSPRKAVPSADKSRKDEEPKKQPAGPNASLPAKKDRTANRRSRLSSIPTPQPAPLPTVEIPLPEAPKEPSPAPTSPAPTTTTAALPTDVQPPAVTPSEPFFSPTPEPQSASRDTPPPGLTASIAASGIPGARPSRRARAPVNYAEPSLVAKMRRPGKGLVDAIEGSADPVSRRVKNSSLGSGKAGDKVVIKIEDDAGDEGMGWKGLPERISPWVERSRRKARMSGGSGEVRIKVEPGLDEEKVADAPPSTATIDSQPVADDELEAAARKLQELDLYDFKETDSSSPANSSTSVPSPEDGKMQARTVSQRRHSFVPREGAIVEKEDGGKNAASVGTAAARGSSRGAGRRRSMLV